MSILLLPEDEVRRLLPMKSAIEALASAFAELAAGQGTNLPRRRARVPGGALNLMGAALPARGYMGVKTYTAFTTAGARHVVSLYSARDGRLLALIEADWLGRIRTGAATGLATDRLAQADAAVLGMIGTGDQAWTQVEAIAAVRALREIRVFGRDRARREHFAAEVEDRLGIPTRAVDSARASVEKAEIVTTMTTSTEPVVLGDWLADGAHVNAAGSNWPHRREVDARVVARADLVVVDDLEQARVEAGDLLLAAQEGVSRWDEVRELSEIVGAPPLERPASAITLFKSIGLALEDVAVAAQVYEAARAQGAGQAIDFGGD